MAARFIYFLRSVDAASFRSKFADTANTTGFARIGDQIFPVNDSARAPSCRVIPMPVHLLGDGRKIMVNTTVNYTNYPEK